MKSKLFCLIERNFVLWWRSEQFWLAQIDIHNVGFLGKQVRSQVDCSPDHTHAEKSLLHLGHHFHSRNVYFEIMNYAYFTTLHSINSYFIAFGSPLEKDKDVKNAICNSRSLFNFNFNICFLIFIKVSSRSYFGKILKLTNTIFEPTCAICTVGSYASLSVCSLSVCL